MSEERKRMIQLLEEGRINAGEAAQLLHADSFSMATSMLDAMQDKIGGPDNDLLIVNVDDDDGDQVQLYIG